METLVILDYSTQTVHIYKVSVDLDIDYNYIHTLGYNPDTCSWMVGEDIEIIKHKGKLII